jgi:hypothetical protein
VTKSSLRQLIAVETPPAANSNVAELRRSLDTLERLRGGWRPTKGLLAGARHAERWVVTRHADATIYQFIGFASQRPGRTSMVIATVLAIDAEARWALLACDRWISLGDPLPEPPPFDPADVTKCAKAWLLRQTR